MEVGQRQDNDQGSRSGGHWSSALLGNIGEEAEYLREGIPEAGRKIRVFFYLCPAGHWRLPQSISAGKQKGMDQSWIEAQK